MVKLSDRISYKALVTVASVVVIAGGLKIAASIVAPVLLALFLAITLHPIVAKLARFKIPPAVSIFFLLSLFMVVVGQGFGLVLRGIKGLIADIPRYQEQVTAFFTQLQETWPILPDIDWGFVTDNVGSVAGFATGLLGTFQGVLINGFLILLITAMLMLEWPTWQRLLMRAAGNEQKATDWFGKLNTYIAVKFGVSILTGLVIGLLLKLVGHQYYAVWGIIALLLNMLPTVGSILAAIPPVLLAAIAMEPWQMGATVLIYLAANVFIGNIIEPKIMGNQVGLPTSIIIISMVFWGWMFGITGVFLSTPLTISVVTLAIQKKAAEKASSEAVLQPAPPRD